MKGERLSIHATGHQGKQDGTGADQWFDDGTQRLRKGNQGLTGIGHTRTTGFTHDSDGFSRTDGFTKSGFGIRLIHSKPFMIVNDHFFSDCFEVATGGSLVLHKKYLTFSDRFENVFRQGFPGGIIEPSGD
jgi:hypothetical protein